MNVPQSQIGPDPIAPENPAATAPPKSAATLSIDGAVRVESALTESAPVEPVLTESVSEPTVATGSTTSPALAKGVARRAQGSLAFLLLFALGAIAWHAYSSQQIGATGAGKASPGPKFAVDPNRADWPELMLLPEIGETLAKRIVQNRESQGPFLRVEDMRRVRGIGPATLKQIRPHLTFDPPDATLEGNGD